VTYTADMTIQAAAQLMMEHCVRHLFVNGSNGPIWMVSARDSSGLTRPDLDTGQVVAVGAACTADRTVG
jgi:hypothetical protein